MMELPLFGLFWTFFSFSFSCSMQMQGIRTARSGGGGIHPPYLDLSMQLARGPFIYALLSGIIHHNEERPPLRDR